METNLLSYSKSKLVNPRPLLNFRARHKKTCLDEYKQSLTSPFQKSRHPSFDKSSILTSKQPSRMSTPTLPADIGLAHYSSLTTFKQKTLTPISKHENLPKRSQSRDLRQSPFTEDSEVWKNLNLHTLYKAKLIIKNFGVAGLSWTYKRQLRLFCTEALKHLEDAV